jgi:hypothetical protein
MPHRDSEFEGSGAQPPEPWASFLTVFDQLLEEPVDLHCIGGFVMTMQFGLSRTTGDIDILPANSGRTLAQIQPLAGVGSALHKQFKVYVQPVGIVTYPENYESRLIRMWPEFRLGRLRIYALEPHDLALTKLERNHEVDRQDVLGLARAGYLDAERLRDRYAKEVRPNLVSGVEKCDLTLALWIEMCWPGSGGERTANRP